MKTKAFTLICEYPDVLDSGMEQILDKLFDIGKRVAIFADVKSEISDDLIQINIEPIKEVE